MSHEAILDEHILNIVQSQIIQEQVDLQNKLKERGYDVPQATLSRRLKKLRIAKVSGVYSVVEFATMNLPLVLNIQVSEFGLIVLHTSPGNASSLGYFLDQKFVDFHPQSLKKTGILGTIAGDDTVLLITESNAHLENVLHVLQEIFPYHNSHPRQ